jgi:hypothetical protein
MSEENTRRKLAEMKTYLEKRVSELNQESIVLSSFLEVVDNILAEKSFRKIEIPNEKPIAAVKPPQIEEENRARETAILAVGGTNLGEILFEHDRLTVTPVKSMRFDVNSPPWRSFLIAKVLEPMRAKDAELSKGGKPQQSEALAYQVTEDDGALKTLVVHNPGDEKRLRELENAIRWTFKRMYEKRS